MRKINIYLYFIFILIFGVLIVKNYLKVKSTIEYNANKIADYYYYCEELSEEERIEKCNIPEEELRNTPDRLTAYNNLIDDEYFYYLPEIVPLMISIFSMFGVSYLFKSKYLYYYIQRKSYKSFVKKIILSFYKYASFSVVFFITMYLLSLTLSDHNYNSIIFLLNFSTFPIQYHSIKHFLLLYSINAIIIWFVFANMCLIIQSKNRKYIFNVIEFVIVYILGEIIVESVLPSEFWLFPTYELFDDSIYIRLIASLIYFTISFIIMILSYKNKEKIMKRIGV